MAQESKEKEAAAKEKLLQLQREAEKPGASEATKMQAGGTKNGHAYDCNRCMVAQLPPASS